MPLSEDLYRRLSRRYGPDVASWCHGLPEVLQDLADRWRIVPGTVVERGSVSAVFNCHSADGLPAILKISPDRERIRAEADALGSWHTQHVPAVLASDTDRGALLIEAIQPGTALDESGRSPAPADLAALMGALHTQGPPRSSSRPLLSRVDSLFESGTANYRRRPDLADLVPKQLYEQGRRSAEALTRHPPIPEVVLHGDLTPANVLDGGADRGLVAVDPTPCWGDPAFDAVDLLFWQTTDDATLTQRIHELNELTDLPEARLLGWCAAFAAMIALELAEQSIEDDAKAAQIAMLIGLAHSTP